MTVISFKTLAGPSSTLASAISATPVRTVFNQWATGPRVVQGFAAIQVNALAASIQRITRVDHVRPHRNQIQPARRSGTAGHRRLGV